MGKLHDSNVQQGDLISVANRRESDSSDSLKRATGPTAPVSEMPVNLRVHKKPGHGAVAIVVEEEKFLVIRRSATVRAPNLLCFAGGTIESGESPQEAIERELLEELGVVGVARDHVWQYCIGNKVASHFP